MIWIGKAKGTHVVLFMVLKVNDSIIFLYRAVHKRCRINGFAYLGTYLLLRRSRLRVSATRSTQNNTHFIFAKHEHGIFHISSGMNKYLRVVSTFIVNVDSFPCTVTVSKNLYSTASFFVFGVRYKSCCCCCVSWSPTGLCLALEELLS